MLNPMQVYKCNVPITRASVYIYVSILHNRKNKFIFVSSYVKV